MPPLELNAERTAEVLARGELELVGSHAASVPCRGGPATANRPGGAQAAALASPAPRG